MRRIVLAVVAALAMPLCSAQAGVWEWSCQGQLGSEQVFFNRFFLYVVKSNKPLGKLVMGDKLGDTLPKDKTEYRTDNGNAGFEKTISAERADDEKVKLVLTEKSSKRVSHKYRQICGRDENDDVYRKVYSLKAGDAAPRDVVMQCREYQLSTSGGKRCD